MAASNPGRSDVLPAGCGLALKPSQLDEALHCADALPFAELVAENHLAPGDRAAAALTRLRERMPLALHGVGLSLGSTDPLDLAHLDRLAELARRLDVALVSEHLSWSSLDGRFLHDLLPLPYLEESIAHVAERVTRVQDRLGRRIALENVASYARFAESELAEWEFLTEVAARADCWILFDVNNAHVSATNLGFAAERYVDALPAERVVELHLAGFERRDGRLLDTHGAAVDACVWRLFERALARLGPLPVVLERDRNLPPLRELLDEARLAGERVARAG